LSPPGKTQQEALRHFLCPVAVLRPFVSFIATKL